MKDDLVLASLAVEYWKLLKSFQRAIDLTPPEARTSLLGQARYSARRLELLLSDARMKVVSFDGLAFEVNMPAIAINAEDVSGFDNPVVEQTIEPAVVSDMVVLLTGKVLLTKATSAEGR